MACENHSALAAVLCQRTKHALLILLIQPGGQLIEQKNLSITAKSTGKAEPPALPSG